jgi:hypothetical protein
MYFYLNYLEIKKNISEDNINLNLDFEQTHNIDFHNLHKKEEQLIKINSKLEKNIREIEKLYDKKFLDIQKVIEQNQYKLKITQQVNFFIKNFKIKKEKRITRS